MRTSLLTPGGEAVTHKKHQTPHLRDVRLRSIERTDHGTVLLTAQVIGNRAEPFDELLIKGHGVPEDHLPDRRYRCLWIVHGNAPFLLPLFPSRHFSPPEPSVRVSRSRHA